MRKNFSRAGVHDNGSSLIIYLNSKEENKRKKKAKKIKALTTPSVCVALNMENAASERKM